MNRNLFWKIALVILLVVLAVWELYPPQETLKQGLDLAGGTSIIYDIDTRGLDAEAKKGLAEKTIKVLRRRIDPSNIMNLEWVAHGNSRIEIKMPLASPDIIQKRQRYNETLEQLQDQNVNLAIVRRSLELDQQERMEQFEQFAQGDPNRLEILTELADVYQARKQLQQQRDDLAQKLDQLESQLKEQNVSIEDLRSSLSQWIDQDPNELEKSIKDFADAATDEPAPQTIELLANYVETYKQWGEVVDQLTNQVDGLNLRYSQALNKLQGLNLTVSQVTDIMDLPQDSAQRQELINQLLANYPGRTEEIRQVIDAYDAYRPFRGRLDGPEDLKRMLKGAGVLEFRIIPIPGDEGFTEAMATNYIDNLKQKGPQAASDSRYVWIEIEDIDSWNTPGIIEQFGNKHYVLASNQPQERLLAQEDGRDWKLAQAFVTTDSLGRPAVGFRFNTVGSSLFYRLTDNNLNRPLAIILDDIALSAPNIQSAISERGIIEGKFTQTEVTDMVSKLDAGSLKARLIEPPVSENTIGPGIGEDNREKGKFAAIIGLAAVAAFMTVYYIGAGIISVLALVLNLLFVLAIMAFSNATFTLPGIAGIILIIGMAVDANVLIFERIREELLKGASLKVAIDSGYKRAFRTIFDANLTTFITAAILFYVASEEIKGFAIVLMLGIVSSMFTALFVTRIIFELLIKMKVIKNKIPMMSIVKNPTFSWMSARPVFATISIVFIAAGLFIFFSRDDQANSKYDIEFTGGTSATITLKEDVKLNRDQVENMIRQQGEIINNPLIQRAKVYTVGETGQEYEISTIETNTATTKVTFTDQQQRTSEQVMQEVVDAYNRVGRELENLKVSQGENANTFVITTSQVNKGLIVDVLNNAFPENAEISEPEINEVVTTAIKDAFRDKLKVLSSLEPEIVSTEQISPEMIESYPEISQYLGGIKIQVKVEESASPSEIINRFESLRFKPDLVRYTRNPYKLLTPNYVSLENADQDKELNEFIFVAVKSQAHGTQLTGKDWENFENTEISRVLAAAKMETSLSRVNQIAPSIGQQAKTQALIAIILSLIAIIGYIWIRFGTARYGLAAIAALVHDVCITLGAVVAATYVAGTPLGAALGIQDFKINLEIIAALLTIIGYSLNDTIVVFDRIRENKGKLDVLNPNIINDSINQTLSRTLLTSFTTFIVVLIMYILGGEGLRGFTFALLIGVIVGTYSSIAIAAPLLVVGQKKKSA